jgi:hypothetical protein
MICYRLSGANRCSTKGTSDIDTLLTSAALLLAVGGNALAGSAATGDQISAAISANTDQGSMIVSGAVTENYGII